MANKIGQQLFSATDAPTQGPDVDVNQGGRWLQGLPGNTGYIYVNETSDMTSTDSYPLSDNHPVIFISSLLVKNLNQLWFLPTVSGEGVAWFPG